MKPQKGPHISPSCGWPMRAGVQSSLGWREASWAPSTQHAWTTSGTRPLRWSFLWQQATDNPWVPHQPWAQRSISTPVLCPTEPIWWNSYSCLTRQSRQSFWRVPRAGLCTYAPTHPRTYAPTHLCTYAPAVFTSRTCVWAVHMSPVPTVLGT